MVSAKSMQELVTGTPPAEESTSRWKSRLNEADCTGNEYECAVASLEAAIETYRQTRGHWKKEAMYVRGDFFGDCTQHCYFYDLAIVTPAFIEHIQSWARSEHARWRVAFCLGRTPEVVMIYADAVRFGRKYAASSDPLASVLDHAKKGG